MRRKNFLTSAALFPIVIGLVAIGTLVGALIVNNLNEPLYESMHVRFMNFVNNLQQGGVNQSVLLFDSIIKYGKFAVVIWLAGFFSVGILLTAISVFSYGLVYGFTTGFIVRQFGFRGLGFACAGYLLQNLVLMPALVFISVFSIRFALDKFGFFQYAKVQKDQRNKEYILSLAVCLACVLLAASIETFFSQGLMQKATILII